MPGRNRKGGHNPVKFLLTHLEFMYDIFHTVKGHGPVFSTLSPHIEWMYRITRDE
jgi:hypothetical protein